MTTDQSVTIERLGHHGDGIAPGPVYVPRGLPGEVVEGAVVDGRMQEPRIILPSQERVRAPCRHYKSCGGCALQHARDAFVADWKVSVVRSAMEANGLPTPIRRMHTSPTGSRRRATFSGRRTKTGATVGFHRSGSDLITSVSDCRVVTSRVREHLSDLEAIVSLAATRKGEVKLAVTDCLQGIDLAVIGAKNWTDDLLGPISSRLSRSGIVRLTWDGETVLQFEPPSIDLDGVQVPLPPAAFLQATREGETALRSGVVEAVRGARRVIDLFAGIGTFALPLARDADVLAVEGDAALTHALEAGWRHADGLRSVQTETRDLFRRPLLADELAGFDAVVIDPPRAGASAQTAEIAKAQVPRVASVSCNPVTFARDAKVLVEAGYHLEWVDVVDQFRWSSHTELVSSFRLNTM